MSSEKEATAQKIAESWEELENQLFELWRFVAKRHASPDRIKEVQVRLEKCTDIGIYLEDPEMKEEGLNQKRKEQL